MSSLRLTERELDALPAEELIRWAAAEFAERLCLTCSWQKQSSVLVHMLAELGLDIDASAQQLSESLRDVQAESRATMSAGESSIELREGPEESPRIFGRDTRAGVDDGETYLASLLAFGFA